MEPNGKLLEVSDGVRQFRDNIINNHLQSLLRSHCRLGTWSSRCCQCQLAAAGAFAGTCNPMSIAAIQWTAQPANDCCQSQGHFGPSLTSQSSGG